ncbi:hypothetical protein PROFUN_01570 [Planoprotostelium fungivorum]|uniref:P2X receptor n=1 Tax=Planoprotostelium fungivorum TaxID=1890364 RepID=A0A2P6NTX5_9EUKA|nr:hypothetical protein PROFUN_01570 [Planoprotostelium fungivorum]
MSCRLFSRKSQQIRSDLFLFGLLSIDRGELATDERLWEEESSSHRQDDAKDEDARLLGSSPDIVKIHDWRLGLLHYGFMLGILIYVAIYAVWYQQGYLQKDQPVGSIRTTIATPTDLRAAQSYPYCLQNSTTYAGYNNYQCIYYSGNNIQFPNALGNPFMVITRTKNITMNNPTSCVVPDQPSCVISDADTVDPTKQTTTRYYSAGVEDYTLFFEHVVYGRSSKFADKNENMEGGFYKGDKLVVSRTLSQGSYNDIITVGQLLDLADSSLDAQSEVSNHTLRYDGLQLVVIIEYSSSVRDSTKYSYKIKAVQIKGVDTAVNLPDTQQSVFSHNGIVVGVVQTGVIGVFSFPALLSAIIGGAVLTGVATTVVDLMAIYVLPEKKFYGARKFDDNDNAARQSSISSMHTEQPQHIDIDNKTGATPSAV